MNIDLLPFAAFALESSGLPERPLAESHTLTLRLTRPLPHSPFGPSMSGRVRLGDIPLPSEGVLHAEVLPAEGLGLTITFQVS